MNHYPSGPVVEVDLEAERYASFIRRRKRELRSWGEALLRTAGRKAGQEQLHRTARSLWDSLPDVDPDPDGPKPRPITRHGVVMEAMRIQGGDPDPSTPALPLLTTADLGPAPNYRKKVAFSRWTERWCRIALDRYPTMGVEEVHLMFQEETGAPLRLRTFKSRYWNPVLRTIQGGEPNGTTPTR